jgi:hypothetical protein
MEDFQIMIEEKEQLDEKLRRLDMFIDGGEFTKLHAAEQNRLRSQRYYMNGYSGVLTERIEAFDK